ncbi:MAG: diacylglycerol kinase family protein [Candidatus Obscuribacter sp.]|nr:diacylglycerol kinase family protein [Candidatus Obscuribacter sp.]
MTFESWLSLSVKSQGKLFLHPLSPTELGGTVLFTKSRVAIIFNPTGGSAKSGKIDTLVRALAAHSIEAIRLTTTAEPGSARMLAQKAAEDGQVDLVIACGGDGTVCQVAEGILAAYEGAGHAKAVADTGARQGGATTLLQAEKLPMAVFPAGTGNLFARAFYAVPDPQKFVQMLVRGQAQPVDMVQLTCVDESGQEHRQLYIVATGFGKLSDAISFASPGMKRWLGKFAYAMRMVAASFNPEPVTYTIKTAADDVTSVQASALFALNTIPPSMVALSRGCNASDGLIDVVLLKSSSFLSLGRMSMALASGRADLKDDYLRIRCRSVSIETDRAVTPNIDGDPGVKTRHIELTAIKGAASIIVS